MKQIENYEKHYKELDFSGLSFPIEDISKISECKVKFEEKFQIKSFLQGPVNLQNSQSFSIEFKSLTYQFNSILVFNAITTYVPFLIGKYQFEINIEDFHITDDSIFAL